VPQKKYQVRNLPLKSYGGGEKAMNRLGVWIELKDHIVEGPSSQRQNI
jgi:hypothetical protein